MSTTFARQHCASGNGKKSHDGTATPLWLFDKINAQVVAQAGQPCQLDAAAADWNAKCHDYFDEKIDALKQDWSRWPTIFCNPPFETKLLPKFIEKAIEASDKGSTVVLILPAWPKYDWLHEVKQRGRVQDVVGPVAFLKRDGTPVTLNTGHKTSNLLIVTLGPRVIPGTIGEPIRKAANLAGAGTAPEGTRTAAKPSTTQLFSGGATMSQEKRTCQLQVESSIKHVKISEIKIGEQIREEIGDLKPLSAFITDYPVFQTLILNPELELVHGYRTLLACRDILGMETVPALISDMPVLIGQIMPNLLQKQYTISERVAIADKLPSFGHGGNRRADQARNCGLETLTADEAAKMAGFGSADTCDRARKVLKDGIPELTEAMDKEEIAISAAAELASLAEDEQRSKLAKKKDWTAKEVIKIKKQAQFRQKQEETQRALASAPCERNWTITDDQSVVPCQFLIVDPPYGITDEPWEPEDLEGFTKDWAGRWASCGADFIAIFFSQRYMWEGRKWFDEALNGYRYQQLPIWNALNNLAPRSREWLKQTWEAIFLYRRIGSTRLIHDEGSVWTGELHDLDCHVAHVPQINYGGHDYKVHPCQKPVSTMKWLINALSRPGEKVVSLFSGVSPCGIAAGQLGRVYHGIESKEEYRRIAEERLCAFGRRDRLETSPTAPPKINGVTEGDCMDLVPLVPDRSINLVLTSPPYGEQRDDHYPSVPEDQYPEFTLRWMAAIWDKLTDDGSVLIVIDPHVKKGVMADYLLWTQLALRDFGWKQHLPQMWNKCDRYPFGHNGWPRHAYEGILWFSKSGKPFCDPKAGGKPSKKMGVGSYKGSDRSKGTKGCKKEVASVTDVLDVPVGTNERGVKHRAQFPVTLAEQLIQTFCPKRGTVLDNFCGSGSTLLGAQKLGRKFYGFDLVGDYCKIARERLEQQERVEALKIIIEDNEDLESSKEMVRWVRANVMKVAPDLLGRYLRLLATTHQSMWDKLPDGR